MAKLNIPQGTKSVNIRANYSRKEQSLFKRKTYSILAFYTVKNVERRNKTLHRNIMNEGKGHTLVLHCENEEIIREFGLKYQFLVY